MPTAGDDRLTTPCKPNNSRRRGGTRRRPPLGQLAHCKYPGHPPLLRDAEDAGPCTVELPVSKGTLASRLSLTPEYFSRVLRELEEAGLILVEGRRIHIPAVERLAAYPGP